MKDFDRWNEIKKNIDSKKEEISCHQGEIWWCSLGLNIGSEEDGKNELFERPVLILTVFNKEMVRIIPLTSRIRKNLHHSPINFLGKTRTLRLSHVRTISTKRLTRRLGFIDNNQLAAIAISVIREFI